MFKNSSIGSKGQIFESNQSYALIDISQNSIDTSLL